MTTKDDDGEQACPWCGVLPLSPLTDYTAHVRWVWVRDALSELLRRSDRVSGEGVSDVSNKPFKVFEREVALARVEGKS